MLVKIYGKNFRSFRDPFELSMVAGDLRKPEGRDEGVIEVPIKGLEKPLRLLRVAAIMGPNASGKSAVLLAASALRYLATQTSAIHKPESKIGPYAPFLLSKLTRDQPVELGCWFVLDDSLYQYEITFTDTSIQSESLICKGEEDIDLIRRQGSAPIAGELIEKSEANTLYVKSMQPNVTVLSKLAQHGPAEGEESVKRYYNALRDVLRWKDFLPAPAMINTFFLKLLSTDESLRKWVRDEMLSKADLGIADLHVKQIEFEPPAHVKSFYEGEGEEPPKQRYEITLSHTGDNPTELDLSEESVGTVKLFALSDYWYILANKGGTLFADELSASLHPRLLDSLVRAVNYPRSEKTKAQLIFASHDTGLLESRDGQPPTLRRDQVYFTEKASDGASKIYSLMEFKGEARGTGIHNIRKRYLSGLYGALPSTSGISL